MKVGAKIMAVEISKGFERHKLNFSAIKVDPDSMKKKLEAIPMLDYDFFSVLAGSEGATNDKKKPTAKKLQK